MPHARLVRVLGALFVAALTLTLSVAASMPSAAATGNPRVVPTDGPACASTPAKPSSVGAMCGTTAAATAPSKATVALPPGTTACASTPAKRSSAAATCAGAGQSRIAPALAAFTATLSAGNTNLVPGGTTSLTATSNQDVGPTPYYIEIFDLTTGALLVECGFGTSCSTSVSQTASTVQTYLAYISGFGTAVPPPSVQATSDIVQVSWATISLAVDHAAVQPGGPVVLTPTASLDVGPTPVWIEIFDATAAAFLVDCGTGSTCSVGVTRGGTGISTYVAVVSALSPTFPPPDIHAQSLGVTVSWISVLLGASPTTVPVGGSATLTATSSLDVGPTPYWLEVFDQATGSRVAVCGSGTSCSTSVSQSSATQHSYVAFVAADSTTMPPPDIRATSSSATVSWTSATVPNLVGAPDSAAPSILAVAGLVLGGDTATTDCNNLGLVTHQSPAAGTSVPVGSAVSVTHGAPPAPPAECP